jgi:predicted RNA-binding protein YlxR (DUF448 family)
VTVAEPIRTCVGCRTRHPQSTLNRFVQRDAGWVADGARRGEGRGTYLCSAACAERVVKNKRFPGLASAAMTYFNALQDTAMHE